MITLSSVVPFIAIIVQPEQILDYALVRKIIEILNLSSNLVITKVISIFFITAAFVSGILRIFVLRVSLNLSQTTGADLSSDMFRRTLNQPYLEHVNRNSSDVISGITQKVSAATSVLTGLISFTTNLVLGLGILIILLIVDPVVASAAILAFGSAYVVITILSKKTLKQNSFTIARNQTETIRTSQEGLGGIREVILKRRQLYFSNWYKKNVSQLAQALASNQFLTLAPRYFMETVALILIGLFTFFASGNSELITSTLPTLGALALGAQRLLPILQQLYGNLSLVLGSQKSIIDVVNLLEQFEEVSDTENLYRKMTFNEKITLEDVRFRYSPSEPYILNDVNIEIKKGECIGFIGETRSGKSTIIDLTLGLLTPTAGSVLIDGKAINSLTASTWQNLVSHVPQHIFLTDTSIEENIAFGIARKDIDRERIKLVCGQASLDTFIDTLPQKYETRVGERGTKLSGGQRQRIGIARALYSNAKVLILDEATNALDDVTERRILSSINKLSPNLTILMITHRTETLNICDRIYSLSAEGVKEWQPQLNID